MKSSTTSAIKRYRTTKLAQLATKSYYLHKRKKDQEMYTLICDEFVSLGGVYIKFLQGVLLRSSIMSKWQSNDRLKIFENLEWEPIDIQAFLKKELTSQNLQQIRDIQPEPFAAGSFGQVYFGHLQNGQAIIIKVLRPMIRETLKYDLKLLSLFSKRFVKKSYPNIQVDLNNASKEFAVATLRETDYQEEARFADEQYQIYKNSHDIVIPRTYLELCTDNMIVQDYISGVSVAQLISMKQKGIDPVKYIKEQFGSDLLQQMRNLGVELMFGIFKYPRIQGDPHPGNIRIMPNNQVGMIDFGISARSSRQKAAYYQLLKEQLKFNNGTIDIPSMFAQFLRLFGTDLYRALQKLSSHSGVNKDLILEFGQMIESNFQLLGGDGESLKTAIAENKVISQVNKIANQDNRFGLVMKIESTEMLRAAQSYTNTLDALGIRQDIEFDIISEVINRVNQEMPWLETEQEASMSIADSLDTISNWLERVAERDPALFKKMMKKLQLEKAIKVTKSSPKKEKNNA